MDRFAACGSFVFLAGMLQAMHDSTGANIGIGQGLAGVGRRPCVVPRPRETEPQVGPPSDPRLHPVRPPSRSVFRYRASGYGDAYVD